MKVNGARTTHPAKVTVLYVGGFGRSGSTLLDRMLAQVPGCTAVGELVHLVPRGVLNDERCGCGVPFSACPFWSEVGVNAFGPRSWDGLDAEGLASLQGAVDRNRHIPAMLAPGLSPAYADRLRLLRSTIGTLYRSIAAVSGSSVVVDSSKHASTAFLLRDAPGIDLRVVHLVRDSRGVAYSWAKRVERPECTTGTSLMPRYGAARSGARWLAYNSMFSVLAASGVPTLSLRYEALTAEPRQSLARVLEHAGVPASGALDFVGNGAVELEPSHSVAGNPMRFENGHLALRTDEEWRSKMPARSRQIVTALTAPLLASYGYAGRTR